MIRNIEIIICDYDRKECHRLVDFSFASLKKYLDNIIKNRELKDGHAHAIGTRKRYEKTKPEFFHD